jgi:hypothetical protein
MPPKIEVRSVLSKNPGMTASVLQSLGWRAFEHFVMDMQTFTHSAAQARNGNIQ